MSSPRLVTLAISGSSLSNNGCSLEVFGLITGVSKKDWPTVSRTFFLMNFTHTALGVTVTLQFKRRTVFLPRLTVTVMLQAPTELIVYSQSELGTDGKVQIADVQSGALGSCLRYRGSTNKGNSCCQKTDEQSFKFVFHGTLLSFHVKTTMALWHKNVTLLQPLAI